MRAFVIADASRRKARPVAALLWEPDPAYSQGRFSLGVASRCTEDNLPLSLAFCLREEGRCATSRDSEEWVRSRIVPESRHNIAEVLLANGLTEYDEVSLFAACKGRSADDDFIAYEVALTPEMERGLSMSGARRDDGSLRGSSGESVVDKLIASVGRYRNGGEVSYALVELPAADSPEKETTGAAGDCAPARRIGEQIRARRLGEGLTQKQLAARAGITQTVISRVESGAGNPTLGLLEDIACALGSTVDVALVERERG